MSELQIAGHRFGKILVIGKTTKPEHLKQQGTFWLCRCDCGAELVKPGGTLVAGRISQCRSCRSPGHTKGGKQTPTYLSWRGMKERCFNHLHTSYRRYGGRGISVCDRWLDFRNFLLDMGERPAGMSLDRINSNDDYKPGNCRWADTRTQARNSSQYKLTDEQVRAMKTDLANGMKQRIAAQKYGVSIGHVGNIAICNARADA